MTFIGRLNKTEKPKRHLQNKRGQGPPGDWNDYKIGYFMPRREVYPSVSITSSPNEESQEKEEDDDDYQDGGDLGIGRFQVEKLGVFFVLLR